jgi:hypothetical protein
MVTFSDIVKHCQTKLGVFNVITAVIFAPSMLIGLAPQISITKRKMVNFGFVLLFELEV